MFFYDAFSCLVGASRTNMGLHLVSETRRVNSLVSVQPQIIFLMGFSRMPGFSKSIPSCLWLYLIQPPRAPASSQLTLACWLMQQRRQLVSDVVIAMPTLSWCQFKAWHHITDNYTDHSLSAQRSLTVGSLTSQGFISRSHESHYRGLNDSIHSINYFSKGFFSPFQTQ